MMYISIHFSIIIQLLAVGENELSRSMISIEPGDDEMVVEFERLQHKINEHKVVYSLWICYPSDVVIPRL